MTSLEANLYGNLELVPTSDDVIARYDSLSERIRQLESENVDLCARHEEARLKGLMQQLHNYEGDLHELHRITLQRHMITSKAVGSFDLLGKKHKRGRVDAQAAKENEARQAEKAQEQKLNILTERVTKQKALARYYRTKAKELDYVRQAQADLVEKVFRKQGSFMQDDYHEALEEAVCSLAPRVHTMRETSAVYAIVHSKLETASEQQREAAEFLERAFDPPNKALREAFGEEKHEEVLDIADHNARKQAVSSANKLLNASVYNLEKAAEKLADSLPHGASHTKGLKTILLPLLGDQVDLTCPQAYNDACQAIRTISQRQIQTHRAAEEIDERARSVRDNMADAENTMMGYKLKLDEHRKDLLTHKHHVPVFDRSHSLGLPETTYDCPIYSEHEFDSLHKKRHGSGSNLSSMGLGDRMDSKRSSLSSDLSRLDSVHFSENQMRKSRSDNDLRGGHE